MSFLMPDEYYQIVANAVGFDINQIADYFRSKYLTYQDHNSNFKNELAQAILRLNQHLEQEINRGKCRDLNKAIIWDEFEVGILTEHGQQQLSKKVITNLAEGYKIFSEKIEQDAVMPEILEKLENLKKILSEFEEKKVIETNNSTANTNIKKIKWTGTPGEFGAIFDLLFDNGFIEVIKDKKSMVRHLFNFFEIKNENNSIIDVEYLYQCFKNKKRSYNKSELKIPFSDNYNKNK